MVVEKEEAMGDKGEGWLLIPALAWLTSIIDRSTDGPGSHNNLERPLPTSSDTRIFFKPPPHIQGSTVTGGVGVTGATRAEGSGAFILAAAFEES